MSDKIDLITVDSYVNSINTRHILELGSFVEANYSSSRYQKYRSISTEDQGIIAGINKLYKPCVDSSEYLPVKESSYYWHYQKVTFSKLSIKKIWIDGAFIRYLYLGETDSYPSAIFLNGYAITEYDQFPPNYMKSRDDFGWGFLPSGTQAILVPQYLSHILKEVNTVEIYEADYDTSYPLYYYGYDTDSLSEEIILQQSSLDIFNVSIEEASDTTHTSDFFMESLNSSIGVIQKKDRKFKIAFSEVDRSSSMYEYLVENREGKFKLTKIIENDDGTYYLEKYRDLILSEEPIHSEEQDFNKYSYVFIGVLEGGA